MSRYFLIVCVLAMTLGGFVHVQAQDIEVNFFYSPTCPFCAKEKIFLQELKDDYPSVTINQYDVADSKESQQFLKTLYQKYQVPESLWGLVPVTFTPTKYFIGFEDKMAQEIESCLEKCLNPEEEGLSLTHTSVIERNISIPFLGEMKLSDLSFPAMAALLGFLDGFNVCSLGALILVLSLVLAFNSRKKILLFGGIFILTTAVVYGFLIFFWYKLFETLAPFLKTMNVLIGVLGIGGGLYFLRQYFKQRKQALICEGGPGEKISSRFLPKLQSLFEKPSSVFLAAAGVLAFAFVLTVVEFPCSAVVPVAFAAVLVKAGLPSFLYVFYMALYVVFYLLDEIIVFLIAFFTSKIRLSSPRFLKWVVLAEAVILFSLGFYYLFSALI